MLPNYFRIHEKGRPNILRAMPSFLSRRQIFRGFHSVGHVAITFEFNSIRRGRTGLRYSFGIFPRVARPKAKDMKLDDRNVLDLPLAAGTAWNSYRRMNPRAGPEPITRGTRAPEKMKMDTGVARQSPEKEMRAPYRHSHSAAAAEKSYLTRWRSPLLRDS